MKCRPEWIDEAQRTYRCRACHLGPFKAPPGYPIERIHIGLRCRTHSQRWGDAVERLIVRLGFKPRNGCRACNRRKDFLNRLGVRWSELWTYWSAAVKSLLPEREA